MFTIIAWIIFALTSWLLTTLFVHFTEGKPYDRAGGLIFVPLFMLLWFSSGLYLFGWV